MMLRQVVFTLLVLIFLVEGAACFKREEHPKEPLKNENAAEQAKNVKIRNNQESKSQLRSSNKKGHSGILKPSKFDIRQAEFIFEYSQ